MEIQDILRNKHTVGDILPDPYAAKTSGFAGQAASKDEISISFFVPSISPAATRSAVAAAARCTLYDLLTLRPLASSSP